MTQQPLPFAANIIESVVGLGYGRTEFTVVTPEGFIKSFTMVDDARRYALKHFGYARITRAGRRR